VFRTTALVSVVLFCLLCLPATAADEPVFIFYGVVTVRDGKTVLIQNPELTDEQVTTCKEVFENFLELDRTFSTGKSDDDTLTYTWGDDEGELSEEGLVPYVACFATPGQFIDVTDADAQPRADRMTFQRSSTLGIAQVGWWAPETTETCSVSLQYYDETGYKVVATLEGDELAVGASGTSPDGVAWEITRIEEKENEILINVETEKGPEGHRFVFWIATKKWDKPRQDSPWSEESEDGTKLTYPASRWLMGDDEVTSFEIRERHPDRIKTWAIEDFALKRE
jgi:hypothetical protein